MRDKFTKTAAKALDIAKKSSKTLEHGYIGTEHLLIGLVKSSDGVASVILSNYGINEDKLMDLINRLTSPVQPIQVKEPEGFTPKSNEILEQAAKEAVKFSSEQIGTEHILIAMIKDMDCTAYRLLFALEVNVQKLYYDIIFAMGQDAMKYKDDINIQKQQKQRSQSILEQYSRDLTEMARLGELDPVIGREEELERMIQILSRRNKNNPCLVGEPGVGKTAIVELLAQKIITGEVPDTIKNKLLFTLDISAMVAGSKYRGEFEERIKKIIAEVRERGDILLFIDEIHTIIGAGGAEGAIDASNILKPSLARGEIQLIGATTLQEFRKYFEKDAALERRFQPVKVDEPTSEQTVAILNGLKEKYEQHHRVVISKEAIDNAVKLADRYINDRFQPDKSIDLIDEASSKVRLVAFTPPKELVEMKKDYEALEIEKENSIKVNDLELASEVLKKQKALLMQLKRSEARWEKTKKAKPPIVTDNDIAEVVAKWTKIPVKKLEQEETKKLLKLEETLHKRVIGQEEAVKSLARAIRRGRVGLRDPKRPIGSFLFLGPTGVGKTELSKALAEAMFGTEQSIIRVDMSEYMEKHSVSKLIGSPPGYVGYEEGGQLSEKVRRNPYSVILFDEIEKAHPDVFNILLQVLDDGHITDAQGKKIDFKNTVIIMTSNAGAQRIVQPKTLGFAGNESEKQDYEDMKKGVMEEIKKLFKPEFINRIDEIMVFHALNKDNIASISKIMIKEISDRTKEQMDITLHLTPLAFELLLEKGYDKKYGARPLRRSIQNLLEDTLAEEILTGKIKSGNKVTITAKDKELKFTVK